MEGGEAGGVKPSDHCEVAWGARVHEATKICSQDWSHLSKVAYLPLMSCGVPDECYNMGLALLRITSNQSLSWKLVT